MRTLIGFCVIFSLASLSFGQNRPGITGSFGNVVFPGGTSSTTPGVLRSFGNVVFPGTGGPRVNVPFSITDPSFGARLGANVAGQNVLRQSGFGGGRRGGTTVIPYAVPVYVGGGYYEQPPVQQQPNVTVIYPPQQTPVTIINQFGPPPAYAPADTVSVYQSPVTSGGNATGQSMSDQPSGYLIALKDHTVYSAVAYWVDGDTLHYFTTG